MTTIAATDKPLPFDTVEEAFEQFKKEHGGSGAAASMADAAFAQFLDNADKSKFYFPPRADGTGDKLYFCGNSLGLQPETTERILKEELEEWRNRAVDAHFEGRRPWLTTDDNVREGSRRLVGAKEQSEVVVMNSLTTNLHLLMVSFYRPTAQRYKIVCEKQPFPSDRYALQSHLRLHGHDVADGLVELQPRDGELCLRTEDVLRAFDECGDEVALVLWTGVQYYTGQFFDLRAICAKAHEKGCVFGVDLAHAVGNCVLRLHDWDVDFAVWCNYKYMNGGPGTIGGAFVHERHARRPDAPRLAGWWGHDLSSRFDMLQPFSAIDGAYGYRLSNPPVVAVACVLASLQVFDEAGGVERLRHKSVVLTGYLEALLQQEMPPGTYEQITPRNRDERGCQLSLTFAETIDMTKVHDRLTERGVVVDFRKPSCIRVAPTPLYNRFDDVRQFVALLKEAVVAEAAATSTGKKRQRS